MAKAPQAPVSVPNGTTTVLRAYRYALDPTSSQHEALARHAGAARWAYNHAIAAKVAAHREWRAQVDQLIGDGSDEQTARTRTQVPIPRKPAIQKAWNQTKGDDRHGVDGICPWWHEVSTYAFQSAFVDADVAWSNWLDSAVGRRRGRRVGYPRFKSRRRSRWSFRIHHKPKQPTIRPVTYRRLLVPRLGEIRVHGTMKPLAKRVARGEAVIQSVTISRGGHRWYASVLAKVNQPAARPNRSQRLAGIVGVDLGVRLLATLSTRETITNPRNLDRATARLTRAQRALARSQKGSNRRERARARVARLHHEVAERRKTALHDLTKRLATRWATVAIEDLNTAGMTASARGTIDNPGRKVRQKAGLNRRVLDASFSEVRRQLDYKTTWYGSSLVVIDRWAPTSKTCSTCDRRNPSLTLAERTFTCRGCGLVIDRDLNAAINIARTAAHPAAWRAAVAPSRGGTQNARRGDVRPDTCHGVGRSLSKREDPLRATPAEQSAGVPEREAVITHVA